MELLPCREQTRLEISLIALPSMALIVNLHKSNNLSLSLSLSSTLFKNMPISILLFRLCRARSFLENGRNSDTHEIFHSVYAKYFAIIQGEL